MRTITLELLRHGPSHNQLLSPLTPYLALCENHAATTVHVPFEHEQMLYRLRAMGHGIAPEARAFQLKDTARVIAGLLGEIPGLTSELGSDAEGPNGSLVHVRLVISASELALLPFELALAPDGFPGAGQALLLQPQTPLCLTRETRRVAKARTERQRDLRVLFATAAPPQVGIVPMEAHLLALRQAVDPWIGPRARKSVGNGEDDRRAAVAHHIHFLPAATARTLRQACATGHFTHVHILAHGIATEAGDVRRYGLAFHGEDGGVDIIDGERLATILCAADPDGRPGLLRPRAVTLAACDSGNVGSIAGIGASVAHALHDAGIPMVVASQFPLSFKGSVDMTKTLYDAFLWGRDPREAVHALRKQLHSELPSHHDWAAIVVYASFSDSFAGELANTRIERTFAALGTALDAADKVIDGLSEGKRPSPEEGASWDDKPNISWAWEHIKASQQRLRDLLDVEDFKSQYPRIVGLLASATKRQAEIRFANGSLEQDQLEIIRLMEESRDLYWRSFESDQNNHWGIVQYLSLSSVLLEFDIDPKPHFSADMLQDLWMLARSLSEFDRWRCEAEARTLALANILELEILAKVLRLEKSPWPSPSPREMCRQFLACVGKEDIELYATRRQIRRYVSWYAKLAPKAVNPAAREFAKELSDLLGSSDGR